MLSGLFKKLLKYLWFLPGFLLWAAFPPMGEKTDVLFALAPLLWLSRRSGAKTSMKRWFALAAYCAAYFAAYGWLSAKYWTWVRTQGRGYGWRLLGVLAVEPVLWCGLELVRSRLLGGFAWNQQGAVRFASWLSAKCGGASVLAGGTRFGDGLEFNSAGLYSFGANGALSTFCLYDKVHLVPFGEFIPGDKWITALQKLAPVGSCTPGELKLLPLPVRRDVFRSSFPRRRKRPSPFGSRRRTAFSSAGGEFWKAHGNDTSGRSVRRPRVL